MVQKDISKLVENDLELDDNSLWVLDKNKKFKYSDGLETESYLRKVLTASSDLSSNSYELETHIKDWNSEYHLSRKRAQLLRGFNYDRSKKVLEVGSGCGAITRFLGETFDDVVAIEGSIARAGIARLRTRDLDNISIICAPFQEIKFKQKFDMIFCIGVFEYSSIFVNSPDPFAHILQYFHDILTPEGEIVIAIENQFGLKYFSSSIEDHNGVMFDGLEGYPRFRNQNAITFGYNELSNMLSRNFNKVDYYFPYPDYKMPSCILAKSFVERTKVAELVSGFNKQTAYLEQRKPLFDERLALFELDKNQMLHFFSNSFLVFAGKTDISSSFNQLGLIYSQNRLEQFQTVTSFSEHKDGGILVDKVLASGGEKVVTEDLTLHKCNSRWIEGMSLHTQLVRRVKEKGLSLDELFEPCKIWLQSLQSMGRTSNGEKVLDGKYMDCIWMNSFIVDNNRCEFIDLEWEWHQDIKLKRLVIKSLFEFLNDIAGMSDLNPALVVNSKQQLITRIATILGIELSGKDFKDFISDESKIAETVYGKKNTRLWQYYIGMELTNKKLVSVILANVNLGRKILRKIRYRLPGG